MLQVFGIILVLAIVAFLYAMAAAPFYIAYKAIKKFWEW